MKEIGRNDPCLCGSGRKYKYCCLPFPKKGRDDNPGAPLLDPGDLLSGGLRPDEPGVDQTDNPGFVDTSSFSSEGENIEYLPPFENDTNPGEPGIAREFIDEFLAEFGGSFESMEDMQEKLGAFTMQKNEMPMPDFHGLSPVEVHDIIHAPFDSPSTLRFSDRLSVEPEAEIITILEEIRKFTEDPRAFKPTKTGALSRAFTRHMKLVLAPYSHYPDFFEYVKVNKESDLHKLHVGRIILEVAGFLRKYKGRFILGRTCRSLFKKGQYAAIYPVLFRSTATKFNWGYWDQCPDVPHMQSFFAFGLYLLSRYGREARPAMFYAKAFLDAFPMLVNEIPPSPYTKDPVKEFKDMFIHRVILRFWGYFGLAAVTPERVSTFGYEYTITATPLLHDVVTFRGLDY